MLLVTLPSFSLRWTVRVCSLSQRAKASTPLDSNLVSWAVSQSLTFIGTHQVLTLTPAVPWQAKQCSSLK